MKKMMENVKILNKYGMMLVNFVEDAHFMQLGDFYRVEFVEDRFDSTKYYSLSMDIVDFYTEDNYFVEIKAQENENFSFVLTNCTEMYEQYFDNFNDMLLALAEIDKKEYEELSC